MKSRAIPYKNYSWEAREYLREKTIGKRVCVGPGQQRGGGVRSRVPGAHAHGNTERQVMDGLWTEARRQQKQSNDPHNNQHNAQYANYWAPLTRKRHITPHPAQPQHTNDGAP